MVGLTSPSGGSTASPHPSLTELAEAAEGVLDAGRSDAVRAHLAGCASCQHNAAELRAVSRSLATVPAPVMPAEVAARLDRVLAKEVERRSRKQAAGSDWSRPPVTLGTFEADRSRRPARRVLLPALAAAVTAAVVAFGAYVASATAGLNEPPVVAAVSSVDLGMQAAVVERAGLAPHRFSRAWQCARQATSGRIIGLASSTVDGTPALLVYTRSGAATQVTVVTGCMSGTPSAGPSALVSRR